MTSPEHSAWETLQPLYSPRSAGPTVQRLVLGGHLRSLREQAGMTTEQAAASIRGSRSKIGRMEHGRVGFKERDIADLLTLYGIGPGRERDALLRLAPRGERARLVAGLLGRPAALGGAVLRT
jgi:transcriptional regulator with XRE-family HTH domain